MTPSIRLRLVVILVALMAVTWVIEAMMTRARARSEVTAVFDAQLEQLAQVLAVTVAHEAVEHDLDGFHRDMQAQEYNYPVVFQVWSVDGRLLFHSPDAPRARIPHEAEGFADIVIEGVPWRALGLELETGELVLVAQRSREREALINKISGHVIEPLGLSMALAVLLIWFGVQGGLAPLRRVTREISGRDERSLEPLPTQNYPAEISGLVGELNSMFNRLGRALERYGRFTGDAAHELRTPLAGLRIQAQAAARATDEGSRQRALQQLITGVDRTTRIIDQLMTLAKLDQQQEQMDFTTVDVRVVIDEVLAEMASLAAGNDIELVTDIGTEPARISGNHELLRILCRNLIDNAVRYTPRGGVVAVRIHVSTDRVELLVEDSGPGIPEEQRAAVFERFHRLAGTGGTGSGLGLAIAELIVTSLKGHLTLSDRDTGTGLRVHVSFPAIS